jgi:hypothetical protein
MKGLGRSGLKAEQPSTIVRLRLKALRPSLDPTRWQPYDYGCEIAG